MHRDLAQGVQQRFPSRFQSRLILLAGRRHNVNGRQIRSRANAREMPREPHSGGFVRRRERDAELPPLNARRHPGSLAEHRERHAQVGLFVQVRMRPGVRFGHHIRAEPDIQFLRARVVEREQRLFVVARLARDGSHADAESAIRGRAVRVHDILHKRLDYFQGYDDL